MDWLTNLAQNSDAPLLAAFALGLLTAISPCPLATNITATAYIAKTITSKKKVLLSGLLYTAGRMFSYTVLGSLIYYGVSQFEIATLFQRNGEKYIGPLMITIGLIMLDVIKLSFLAKGTITEKLSEKFKNKGLLGSFLLGLVFALAFCPYSGALFFAILMPMTLSASEGLALPVIFSVGTGLPVMLFSFVIAFSLHKLGVYFKAVKKVEKIMRIAAGVIFILTGLYYINIYLKLI
ncbi:MAG: sulfite exporter TauE/SafE family protein [Chitinophagaceae bacterium]|nr:sulfite exporter TauE/SafE family protein [Chitinophagaceae bacterium]